MVRDIMKDSFMAELTECEFYAYSGRLSHGTCQKFLRKAELLEDIYH